MNIKFIESHLIYGIALFCVVSATAAIKVEIPEAYRERVEAFRERASREQDETLATYNEADYFTGERPAIQSESPQASSEAENSPIMESVDAAEQAAVAFEDTLEAGQGLISGQVVDKDTGQPVSGVAIVLEGTTVGTVTDPEGRYKLGPAPAGVYTMSFLKAGYIEANVTEYKVVADQVNVFPFALPPRPAEMSDDVYELQDFTVTAEEANDLMMKLDLKLDTGRALDVFSSEDFSKFAASDVADAVKRIAGVSVNDGKFPSVRGLNDRYTVTQLNGMPLPSPDPFRKSPQLDIFPSALLETIVVSKSSSADLDGESTAANFNLVTKKLPEEFFLNVSIGTGWHSNSIEEFRTFDHGKDDGYLYTDGADSMNQAPREDPTSATARTGILKSRQIGSESARAHPNSSMSLSFGDSFEFKNERRIGYVVSGYHKRDTSAVLDATENQNYDFSGANRLTQVFRPPSTINIGGTIITLPGFFETVNLPVPYGDQTTYDYQEFEENIKMGILLGGSVELGEDHSFFGNFFSSRTADTKVTRNFNGTNADEGITEANDLFLLRERLYYVERSLSIGQFGGEHLFPDLIFEPEMNWAMQSALTTQDEPDFRDTTVLYRYSDFPNGIPQSPSPDYTSRNINSGDNISRSTNSWRTVLEKEKSVRADFVFHPREDLEVLTGGLSRRADRETNIQSYIENRADTNASGQVQGATGVSEANLRNASTAIRGTSEAYRDIDATYLAIDYKPSSWARLNFGYRFEKSVLSVSSNTLLPSANNLATVFRQYDLARTVTPATGNSQIRSAEADVLSVPDGYRNTTGTLIEQKLEDDVSLPSANFTLDPFQGVQMKFGYFETINRPSFREITADIFIDTENGDYLGGNPFLESSRADNYDFRIEFYPKQFDFDIPLLSALIAEGDMLGISLFSKKIEKPIEFIRPTDQNIDEIPFNNPEGATAEGIEFEFTKSLSFVPLPWFEYFSFGGNIALTDAVAGVSDAEARLLGLNATVDAAGIGDERPLTEQPEKILNLNFTFDQPDWGTTCTLAYNQKSEVLQSIGSSESYDAYRGATERLDLIISQKFNSGFKVSFSVKNVLNQGSETYYRNRSPDLTNSTIGNLENPGAYSDDKPRRSVNAEGVKYSVSASYSF